MKTIDVQRSNRYHLEALLSWTKNVLSNAGLSMDDASTVANNILEAEAFGVRSHGFIILKVYVDRIMSCGIRAAYTPFYMLQSGTLNVINGDGGPGQTLCMRAAREGITAAKQFGISLTSVVNSNHAGMLATYAIEIAKQNCIAIVLTNSGPAMNVFDGLGKTLGNNAFCFAFPTATRPLVLDMATGTVACGKVRWAALHGEKIPADWILDKRGFPTNSPEALDEGGSVIPFGHYKGFGMAILVDLLTGVLNRSVPSPLVKGQRAHQQLPTNATQTVIVIDPSKWGDVNDVANGAEEFLTTLRRAKIVEGGDSLTPWDREYLHYDEIMRNGIVVSNAMLKELEKISVQTGTPFAEQMLVI